jgi:hypothetical protein
MKKSTYYHHDNPQDELSIFINNNNSVTIEIENHYNSFIVLPVEDIEDLILELECLVNKIKRDETRP